MRKLVVTEFMSLDGVFEAPGPDGSGFKYEGWTMPYVNEEFIKFKSEELKSADIQLLGRITYEGFAKAWPQRSEDEFSDKFNSMPKYVVSNTLIKADWNNSHIIKGDNVVEEIKKLKAGEGGDIVVHGSGVLTRFLLDKRLVDEISFYFIQLYWVKGKSYLKVHLKLI